MNSDVDIGNEADSNDEGMESAVSLHNIVPRIPASQNLCRGFDGALSGKTRIVAPTTWSGTVSVSNKEATNDIQPAGTIRTTTMIPIHSCDKVCEIALTSCLGAVSCRVLVSDKSSSVLSQVRTRMLML